MSSLNHEGILADLEKANETNFDTAMQLHTLVGNLSHWRTNMRDNKRRQKIFVGRAKIFNLLARFQVKKD